jgi:hypothetical protein
MGMCRHGRLLFGALMAFQRAAETPPTTLEALSPPV